MTYGVEYVREICAKRNLAVSMLEKECGFSNGYLNPKKLRKIPYERAVTIANYLNADLNRILGNIEQDSQFTRRDERDIARDLDRIMEEIRSGEDGPLYYNGTEIDEASLNLLENAIEFALKEAKKENKIKYNPYKNQNKNKNR